MVHGFPFPHVSMREIRVLHASDPHSDPLSFRFLNQLEKDLSAEGNGVCNYACLIRDFEGRGSFEVRETVYELDGENRFGYDVVVVLEGKNSRTGENVRYESRQTFL